MNSDDGDNEGKRDGVRSRANETRADAESADEREWRFVDEVGPGGVIAVIEDTTRPRPSRSNPSRSTPSTPSSSRWGSRSVGVLLVGF